MSLPSGHAFDTTFDNVGVENISDVKIKIYPNPASDLAFIEFSGTTGEYMLTLCNVQGQEFIRQNLTDKTNTIETGRLVSGIYLLKITELNTYKSSTYKIIKL